VVQQLFAAGMHLQAIDELGDRSAIRRRTDAAIEALDHAIADLRDSIEQLQCAPRDTLRAELARAVDEAELLLGYRPTVELIGPVERGEIASHDIIAVLREALTNVARHAHATQVHVCLAADHDQIRLTVRDNGDGIKSSNRASGTCNMLLRAQQHDGSCEWLPATPSGTLVQWTIPDPAD